MRLEGKVAIVTGGAQGIGRGIVRRMAEEGARIVIADLPGGKGPDCEKEMCELGHDVSFIPCDVTNEDMVRDMVAGTVKKYGKVDILVNDAGILVPQIDFDKTELDYFRKVVDVNLTGTFLCMREVIRHFLDTGAPGSIVNIASTGGIRPREGMVPYACSKAGAIMAAQVCAKEFAEKKIRANAVVVGTVKTEIPISEELEQVFLKSIPDKELNSPDDIANAAVFLASDEARHVTGVALAVDGARLLI